MLVGLLLALALNRAMPGWLLYFFRLAFFLPVIIAAAFVSIVWGYFFQDAGIFNYYLSHLGLPTVRWLTNAQSAMPSIVFMDVWKNTGFFMIIFIAALQGVPKNIMEAAIMDGASPWRRFWRITLPWISPVVFFAVVYAWSIGALQVYEIHLDPHQSAPWRRHPFDVDQHRGGWQPGKLPDRLWRFGRRGHDRRRHPHHHRRAVVPVAPAGPVLRRTMMTSPSPPVVAAGRDPAIHGQGRAKATNRAKVTAHDLDHPNLRRVRLGGRVKPSHDGAGVAAPMHAGRG